MTKARQKQRKKARAAGLTKQRIPHFPPLIEEAPDDEQRQEDIFAEPSTVADNPRPCDASR
jgi:hypothetical protein